MSIGFTSYDTVEATVQPTVQEMLASLAAGQAIKILNGFAKGVKPLVLCHREGINRKIVLYFYAKIALMAKKATEIMRQEILVTAAVNNEEGEITTPAVYNDKPSTAVQLQEAVLLFFTDFTSAQVGAIVNTMVLYAKADGSAIWTFYSDEVVK